MVFSRTLDTSWILRVENVWYVLVTNQKPPSGGMQRKGKEEAGINVM